MALSIPILTAVDRGLNPSTGDQGLKRVVSNVQRVASPWRSSVPCRRRSADRWIHFRRNVEIDPLDFVPEHVVRALTADEEDQHARVSLSEVAPTVELQALAAMEGDPGARFATLVSTDLSRIPRLVFCVQSTSP